MSDFGIGRESGPYLTDPAQLADAEREHDAMLDDSFVVSEVALTEASMVLRPEAAAVARMIDRLGREDRANLRVWLLARYEDDGSEHRRVHDK